MAVTVFDPFVAHAQIESLGYTVTDDWRAALSAEAAMRMGVVAAQNVVAGLARTLDPALVVNMAALREADPDDRATWGGDHFDMTPRRRWFEAYHKTAGYFTMMLAVGAVATGLSQY